MLNNCSLICSSKVDYSSYYSRVGLKLKEAERTIGQPIKRNTMTDFWSSTNSSTMMRAVWWMCPFWGFQFFEEFCLELIQNCMGQNQRWTAVLCQFPCLNTALSVNNLDSWLLEPASSSHSKKDQRYPPLPLCNLDFIRPNSCLDFSNTHFHKLQ